MYQRILVPLDGSKVGEAALPSVEALMSKFAPGVKTEITLLQVISQQTPYVTSGEAKVAVEHTEKEMEYNKQKAMDYLNSVGEALRSKGATVSAKVGIGSASEEIVKASEEINADLIAMSTHGRSGLSRWAFGSVTEKVLRHKGKVPVLVVRAPEKT